ncbi:YraN family protein [Pelagibius sp. Alg239-R121]|uniref:YraN family protein n=1 Tax=Pelagibius sp. Alg239-R121 TaxID=2993448 RepID=UPI0024A652D6|nr:YraN family protein [Pelagibius sp. Alg239-R121]
MTGKKSRLKAYRRGRWAELIAAIWLVLKGYRLVARSYRTASGEIDLIVRKGRLIVFVEVKARTSLDIAQTAINHRQQQRIRQAAAVFLQRNRKLSSHDCRFDAILIAPKHWPRHIRDAWRESSG